MSSEQPPTGTPESQEVSKDAPLQTSPDGGGNEGGAESNAIIKPDDDRKKHVPLLANSTQASLSVVPQLPAIELSGNGEDALLVEIRDLYDNIRNRLMGISGLPRKIPEALIEKFRSVIVIVLGKRLGGVLGSTATEEGHRRCEAAAEYLPTLQAMAPNATLIAGASGYREEGDTFTAYIKELLNKRQFNWQSSVKFFTERNAKNTFENILFCRAEVLRLFNPPSPRLWVVSSSDNHLGSLLLKDRSLPSEVTELGLLRQDESDATAFLSAPYPYRGGDPGLNWLCRIIDTAFLAAPLQANLYGIRNGASKEAQWNEGKNVWEGVGQIKLNQVYEYPVMLLEFLIHKLENDKAPLTEYKSETQCAYLVSEVRNNVASVLDPLKEIHGDLRRVQGLENGKDFTHWHGVNLDYALEWVNKLVARLRWFADIEASDADRERVRQKY